MSAYDSLFISEYNGMHFTTKDKRLFTHLWNAIAVICLLTNSNYVNI